MILEAYKIVTSLLPLIKEAFLWRDGAEEGKPITRQNLIRRKIAVFALIGSLVFNYFITGKVVEYYKQNKADQDRITQAQMEISRLTEENKLVSSNYAMTENMLKNLQAFCTQPVPLDKVKSKKKVKPKN